MTNQNQKASIVVTTDAGAFVVEFVIERLLDEVDIASIGERLDALLAQTDGPPLLVLDFARVRHMSSSALGMLITLHKKIRDRGGRLALCDVHPEIYEVFLITKLSEVFHIYENRATAMTGLA